MSRTVVALRKWTPRLLTSAIQPFSNVSSEPNLSQLPYAHFSRFLHVSACFSDKLKSAPRLSIAALALLGVSASFVPSQANALAPAHGDHSLPDSPPKASAEVKGNGHVMGRYAVADAVAKVENSVVNIRRTTMVPIESNFGMFSNIFGAGGDYGDGELAVGPESTSGGSGFFFDRVGTTHYIMTNSHVVEDLACPCDECRRQEARKARYRSQRDVVDVRTATGDVFSAEVVAADQESDIAVLAIESNEELPLCSLGDSDTLRPGEFVIAVGSPLTVLSNSCSFGIVSNVSRDVDAAMGAEPGGQTFVQVDCAVNPGSSGGPLCDLDGVVRGILCMKIGVIGQGISEGNGDGDQIPVEGISFAIPVTRARKVVEELMEFGEVRKPFVGLALVAINESVLQDMQAAPEFSYLPKWLVTRSDDKEPKLRGLIVHGVERDSPANAAKLLRGDLITHVDDAPVSTAADFMAALAFKVGKSVTLSIRRGDSGKVETVRIEPTPASKLLNNI